jgi:DNA-binding transcriptional regulator YiaG
LTCDVLSPYACAYVTGREFRVIRLRIGLTQRKLAERLDVDRETVNAWENGRRKIPTMAQLAVRYLSLEPRGKG